MAFDEVRINDGLVIYDTNGGSEWSTDITTLNSGFESRNQNWVNGRSKWQIGARSATKSDCDSLNAFFRARKGKSRGFRFKDWMDFKDTDTLGSGILAITNATNTPTSIGIGNGTNIYQLYKAYPSGGVFDYRMIRKPVAGTIVVKKNGVAATVTLDPATGLVTFPAMASASAIGVTAGVQTALILPSIPNNIVPGNYIYLSGFSGADAALLNGLNHQIVGVSRSAIYAETMLLNASMPPANGPYIVLLATNTLGKIITLGTGISSFFPQATDVLTWTGEFDVPVRFDTDLFDAKFLGAEVNRPGTIGDRYFYLGSLPIVEIRT